MATDTKGMDRRTLIKGAAAAGVTAWAAPVIIDSLTSPAAAGSANKRWEFQTVSPCVASGTAADPGNGAAGQCATCTPGTWTMAPASGLTGWGSTPNGTGTTPSCARTAKTLSSSNNCSSGVRVNTAVFSIISPCTFVSAEAIKYQRTGCNGSENWFNNGTLVAGTINNTTNPRTVTFPAIADPNTYYAVFRLITTGTC